MATGGDEHVVVLIIDFPFIECVCSGGKAIFSGKLCRSSESEAKVWKNNQKLEKSSAFHFTLLYAKYLNILKQGKGFKDMKCCGIPAVGEMIVSDFVVRGYLYIFYNLKFVYKTLHNIF